MDLLGCTLQDYASMSHVSRWHFVPMDVIEII
jgi:hypothetical protein